MPKIIGCHLLCASGLRNWDGSCGSLLWPSPSAHAPPLHGAHLGQVFACHAARQKPRNTRPAPPPQLLHIRLTLAAAPACNFQKNRFSQHCTSAGHSGFETSHLTTGLEMQNRCPTCARRCPCHDISTEIHDDSRQAIQAAFPAMLLYSESRRSFFSSGFRQRLFNLLSASLRSL